MLFLRFDSSNLQSSSLRQSPSCQPAILILLYRDEVIMYSNTVLLRRGAVNKRGEGDAAAKLCFQPDCARSKQPRIDCGRSLAVPRQACFAAKLARGQLTTVRDARREWPVDSGAGYPRECLASRTRRAARIRGP